MVLLTAVIIEFLLAVVVAYLAWQFFSLRSEYELHMIYLHDILEKLEDIEEDKRDEDIITDSFNAARMATRTDTPIPPAYRAEDDDPSREDQDIKRMKESQRGFFS